MVRRGFSLIELALVVAIVGIVAAIAVPRYAEALSRYRADAAAKRLVADLESALSRAKAASASYRVTADLTGERLSVIGPLPDVTVVASTEFGEAPYHAGLAVNALASESITIDGYGRPDRAVTFTVSSGDTRRTVTLSIAGEVTSS